MDGLKCGRPFNEDLYNDLYKTSHRDFTTAYMLGKNADTQNFDSSKAEGDYDFIANVICYDENNGLKVMQRNCFCEGDELEVLSSDENFNKKILIKNMKDEYGKKVTDAKIVQQILYIDTDIKLKEFDILRKKKT